MNPEVILDLPLVDVLRFDIALPMQHMLKLYTIGHLLHAWNSPRKQRSIEQVFDSPQQARHAVQVCGNWIGRDIPPAMFSDTRCWKQTADA